ncbi:MAG TPA: hypothetical protein VFV86_12770 [Nitrososphaeraceae archaeon]|nr:hypothetical protein [Nitrososphaeraceae archaeon]
MLKSHAMFLTILTMMMTGLVLGSPYAFGAKPDKGFLGSMSCKLGPTKNNQMKVTCCWREGLAKENCQTCTFVYEGEVGQGSYQDCTDVEIRMLDLPPNPPSSSPSGPAAPLQDDGVLEQPEKQSKGSVMNLPNSDERTLK